MAETARVLPLVRAGEGPRRASVLGAFRLAGAGGADSTPRAKKTRALLAYVLLAPGPVPRERLAALFWGDRGEDQAKASLRQALYELRDLTAGPEPLLLVRREDVARGAGAVDLDVDRLAAWAQAGEVGHLSAALEAADLTLLADLDGAGADFDDWLAAERTRWRDRIAALTVCAGEAALAEGRSAEARRLSDALERADPLNEPAVRLGLAADRAAGDLAALHRRYRRFAEHLRRDLGAEPAPETQALLQAGPATPAAEPTAQAAASPTLARRRLWTWLSVAAAVLVVALVAGWSWSRLGAPPASPSIAVLPFEAQGQGAYFGSGVSEAVADLLARDRELRVVGSASARQFAAGEILPTARRLGVSHVLVGEARSSQGRMSLSARLVRARDGREVWVRRYDRPAEDVFAVQSDIAAAVAAELGASLAPRRNPHLATRPEVYDRYLQARGLARERRTAPLAEARRLLSEAVRLDPDYAPAHAELAQVVMLLADHPTSYGDIPIPQAQAEARRHARRALELAPELGDAYAAYGLMSLSDGQSLPFYQRAVALEPQRADFHRWLAQALSAMGREQDALVEYQRAAALDPLHWLSVDHLVGQLDFLGRGAEAQAVVERFARVSSDPHGVARVRGSLAKRQGRLADYLRLSEAAARRWPSERTLRSDVAHAWAMLGEDARAIRALAPQDEVGRLSLSGDMAGLAAHARRLGRSFWDVSPGYWGFAEGLVRGGEGALLLQLYDAEFEDLDDFWRRASPKALSAGPALIAAFTDAGRREEADALAARILRRLEQDVAAGMDPAHAAYDRATLLALSGREEEAVRELAAAVRGDWANTFWVPVRLSDRLAFRGLAAHPRLAQIQTELDARVNRERRLLGLPPL